MSFSTADGSIREEDMQLGDFEEVKRVTPRCCDAGIETHEHVGDFKEW
jgi:hypothetical protein